MAAVKIRIACYNHTGLDPLLVSFVRFNHLRGKLVSRNPGVVKIGEGPAVRAKITAAYAAVQKLEQNLSFFSYRLLNILDLHFAGSVDVHCFHGVFLLNCCV